MNTLMLAGITTSLIIPSAIQTVDSSNPDKVPSVQSHDLTPAVSEQKSKLTPKSPGPIVYARSGKEIVALQVIEARRAWLLDRAARLLEREKKTPMPKAD